MRNKLMFFCLTLLLIMFPVRAEAQEFDPEQSGSISVSLISKEGAIPVEGAEFSVFYVAEVERNAEGKLIYRYADDFAPCSIPLNDPELAGKLDAFVTEHPVACRKMVTDVQGSAACQDLALGLYFVKQTGEAEDFAPCASFLVTVPVEAEGDFVYHVDASPKVDVVRVTDIHIQKVWNIGTDTGIADSVTVQLLLDETVVETAVLNGLNNWKTVYTDMPESDGYCIKEINVPQGFTATYSRNGYKFTVTNTYTLAQTGQLVWPIPVFALAGIVLLMLGLVLLRKPGKAHA